MRSLDAWAIEAKGVPSLELMERAGSQIARIVTTLTPNGPVGVVCGKGNNGGDGLVAARHLREQGFDVRLALLWPPEDLSGDARTNAQRLEDAEVVTVDGLKSALDGCALIVDALLGTGFEAAPRAPVDAAIDAINELGCPVVSVDVPSGVDASTGEVAGACVRARTTVALQGGKVGLRINPGKAHAGRVEVVDIGIPVEEPDAPGAGEVGLIDASALELPARRGTDGNKFKSGSVLVVGGSTGLTGAVCLAGEAAMRAGAGWVRAGVPSSLNEIFEIKLTEVMSLPFADSDGHLAGAAAEQALEATERADAVALGPGLGRTKEAFAVARSLIERIECALVVDADGLNALAAAGIELAAAREQPAILTPHAGELARLLQKDSGEVETKRLESARAAAERSRSVVVLKGDDTIVVDGRSGAVGISSGGSPGLATAGTGDVLTGVIAAMLARGLEPFEAACVGVRAHAGAGRVAAERFGAESVIAGDVVDALPDALRRPT